MDPHHKYAYRFLLYWAMLDIRPIAWVPNGRLWANPWFWRRHLRRVRELGELADWLHNLADFSRRGFVDFDERQFWAEFEGFRAGRPVIARYRSLFENALTESRSGRWPTIEEQQSRDAQSGLD